MNSARTARGAPTPLAVLAVTLLAAQPGRADPADERSRLEQGCRSCHPEVAAQWQQSYHRQSYTDPDYAAALAREPRRFCRGCHAPEADARRPATGWAASSGVACVTCHLQGRVVLTGEGSGRRAPHALRRQADFAAQLCPRCHEFEFPDRHRRERPELMQSTVSEHRDSGVAADCVDCHMQRRDGRRGHGFPGGHDAALVRGALQVQAERAGATLRLQLRPLRIGHALPTGDLFRRLLIEAVVEEGAGAGKATVVARALQRHFGMEQQQPGRWVKVTELDDRLVEPTLVTLELPAAAAGRKVRWQVRYQRVAHPLPGSLQVALDGEVVMASGVL